MARCQLEEYCSFSIWGSFGVLSIYPTSSWVCMIGFSTVSSKSAPLSSETEFQWRGSLCRPGMPISWPGIDVLCTYPYCHTGGRLLFLPQHPCPHCQGCQCGLESTDIQCLLHGSGAGLRPRRPFQSIAALVLHHCSNGISEQPGHQRR
jgi:hypothetical protein